MKQKHGCASDKKSDTSEETSEASWSGTSATGPPVATSASGQQSRGIYRSPCGRRNQSTHPGDDPTDQSAAPSSDPSAGTAAALKLPDDISSDFIDDQ